MHLIIADDHTLFRDALAHFIRRLEPAAEIIAVRSLQETLDVLKSLGSVDVVLLDMRMPGMFGLSGLSRLREEFPTQKVAILSGTAEEDDVRAALDIGAVAYFPKTMSGAALVKAIHLVMEGERFVPLGDSGSGLMPSYRTESPGDQLHQLREDVAKRAMNVVTVGSLTGREREVLGYLVRGASNKDIAKELNLQIATIKLHVRGICRKLNAKNRTQAALTAQQMGIME